LSGSILFGRSPFYLTPFPSPNGEGVPKYEVRKKRGGLGIYPAPSRNTPISPSANWRKERFYVGFIQSLSK